MSQIIIRKKATTSLVILLATLIFLVLLLLNQWYIFVKAQGSLEEEITAMESLKPNQETISRLANKKSQLMNRLETIQYMMPSNKDHAGVLGYLNSIFMEHNVNIIQLEIGNYTKNDDFSEIPLNISLKGQFGEIIELIKEFREGSRPLRIDEVRMDIGDDNAIVYCDIIAYAFFREDKQ